MDNSDSKTYQEIIDGYFDCLNSGPIIDSSSPSSGAQGGYPISSQSIVFPPGRLITIPNEPESTLVPKDKPVTNFSNKIYEELWDKYVLD